MLPSMFFRNTNVSPFRFDWDELDRFWDVPSVASPAYEVEDAEGHFLISVDLPGVPQDKIQIEAEGPRLSIRGERPLGEGRGERKFALAFQLPRDVDRERVEASFDNGVLRVVLPKHEEAKPRKIEIQQGKSGIFAQLLKGENKKTA